MRFGLSLLASMQHHFLPLKFKLKSVRASTDLNRSFNFWNFTENQCQWLLLALVVSFDGCELWRFLIPGFHIRPFKVYLYSWFWGASISRACWVELMSRWWFCPNQKSSKLTASCRLIIATQPEPGHQPVLCSQHCQGRIKKKTLE